MKASVQPITPAVIAKYENRHGALKPGDIVVFRSGWSDQHLRPFPKGNACMADPLNGHCEGWPAPGPEAVRFLAKKGVRCVATDGGSQPYDLPATLRIQARFPQLLDRILAGVFASSLRIRSSRCSRS